MALNTLKCNHLTLLGMKGLTDGMVRLHVNERCFIFKISIRSIMLVRKILMWLSCRPQQTKNSVHYRLPVTP